MRSAPGSLQLNITSYGTYVHVKDALFELTTKDENGSPRKLHFAARKVKSIVFTVPGALSTEAVKLALTHNIDIVFAESNGQPLGRVWHSRLGSTTRIRKEQLRASIGPQALAYTIKWLNQKLEQQATLLTTLRKHRKRLAGVLDDRRERIHMLAASITALEEPGRMITEVADTIRGIEGTAGRLYFQTLSSCMPEAYSFDGRSFRPALDPFNAFLNYAYGVLYGRTEKALMLAGLDPYVGFLHRDDYNQKSMVYDFIEPYRIHADYVVFRLFSGKRINREHFTDLSIGVGLTKEGKELLLTKLTKYLDEDKVRHRRRNLTRMHVMQLEAHRFANEILAQEPPEELQIEAA
jgi:CRISPR-associated protein Cas1